MQDEIARLQEELAKIEQLMDSSESLRQQLPDAEVDRMLESWHKQAEGIRAQLSVKGNVSHSQLAQGSSIAQASGGVAIVGNHNLVIENLTAGLARLPTNYATRIQNFLYEYLGRPDELVPFGGRQASLSALNAWLSDPNAPPYALLAAPAGRGKSALLVRWLQSLIAPDTVHLIFIPISIRFNTALQSVAFTALAARLGEVYGEPVQWANLSAEQWRGVCQSYLSRTPPDGKPLLVILDGLDEAADWRAGEDLFPRQPPPGVRAVVSARYLAGDVNESGWRRRLGWMSEKLAVSLPLPPLTLEGLQDVLRQMGKPLDQLTTKVNVVSELYRLSEGDPLLVRLYVESLLPFQERLPMISPEELEDIPPGLSGYFERWWEDQEKQWQKQGRSPLDEREEVFTFFNLCAAALGPLKRDEIAQIAGGRLTSGLRLKKIAKEVERFVIGDGKEQGYTFSHPRLGYYFWGEMTPFEQEAWEARFTDFGRHTLEALNDGTLEPHNAPPYAIQYVSAHLKRAEASPEAFYELVSQGWMRAWEALEGTHTGFFNEVERAWQRAEAERNFVIQIKCMLCYASIATLSANMSSDLLSQAVTYGLLTGTQALVIAKQMPDEERRTDSLSKLAPLLPKELLGEALAIALAIEDEWARVVALSELTPHLTPAHRHQVLWQMGKRVAHSVAEEELRQFVNHLFADLLSRVAKTIWNESTRREVLSWVAPYLPRSLHFNGLQAVQTISNDWRRGRALTALACYLSDDLLDHALKIARAMKHEQAWTETLSELVAYLPEPKKSAVMQEVLAQSQGYRRAVLIRLGADLPSDLLHEALEAVLAINHNEPSKIQALSRLAPRLSDELLCQALGAARAIVDHAWRARALRELACYFPDSERTQIRGEALEAARAISSGGGRAAALSGLVRELPKSEQKSLVHEALEASRRIADGIPRSRWLDHLAAYLPSAFLIEQLALYEGENEERQAEIIRRIAPHLPSIKGKLISMGRRIQDKRTRVGLLTNLAKLVPSLSDEVLRDIQVYESESELAGFLKQLIPYLRPDQYQVALQMALLMKDETKKVEVLKALVSYLSPEQLSQALQAVQTIQNEESLATTLFEIVRQAPSLLPEALRIVRELSNDRLRGKAFVALVESLPEPEKWLIIEEALLAVQMVKDTHSQYYLWIRLLPHVPPPNLWQAWSLVLKMRDREFERARALANLAKRFPEPHKTSALREVFVAIRSIEREDLWTRILSDVIDQLCRDLLVESLTMAREMKDLQAKTTALSQLAPYLPNDLLLVALNIARTMEENWWRATALGELLDYLPEAKKWQAIYEATEAITERPGNIWMWDLVLDSFFLNQSGEATLVKQLPSWAQAQPPLAYSAWCKILRRFAARSRREVLFDLDKLIPFVLALADDNGEQTAVDIFHTIQEVCSWWP